MHKRITKKNIGIKQPRRNPRASEVRINSSDAVTSGLLNSKKEEMCPKIILKGWWWKKYFSYYRKLSETTNALYLHDWMNGGYENYLKMMDILIDQTYLSVFDQNFNCNCGGKNQYEGDIRHRHWCNKEKI